MRSHLDRCYQPRRGMQQSIFSSIIDTISQHFRNNGDFHRFSLSIGDGEGRPRLSLAGR